MSMAEPNCYKRRCKYFQGIHSLPQTGRMRVTDQGVPYCKAFPAPEGIPSEISYGDNLHLEPLPDQGNKVVYEKA